MATGLQSLTSYTDPVTKLAAANLREPQKGVFEAEVANTAQADPLLDEKAHQQEQFAQSNINADTKLQQSEQQLGGQMQDYAKFTPTPENKDPLLKLFALTAATTFLGGGGRQSGVNAMTNLTSAMQGYGQGRQDLFKEQLDKYHENITQTQNHNQLIQDKIREVQSLWTTDRDKAQQEMVKLGAMTDSGLLKNAARTGNLDKLSAMLQQQQAVDMQMKALQAKLNGGLADPNIEGRAQAIANYQLPLPSAREMSTPQGHALMAKILEIQPKYQAQRYPEVQKAMNSFGTGKEGAILRSMNVSISHLNTLNELVDALGNSDTKKFNEASNKFQSEFGGTAPGNFDAAKQIVGDEIVKAIVGAGGGVGDREKAQAAIDNAKSPDQLRGVIATYKKLLAGQVKGLKKQYADTTGMDDFDSRLEPSTLQAMADAEGGQNSGTPQQRKVTRTGTDSTGRKVVQYDDGTTAYAE